MVIMMLGNFLQIVIWGVLFLCLGEFSELYEAVYHSAVNFSSLGYGDVVMSARWKLLGPLEAGSGVLMFGMTSAALVTILQQLIKTQFAGGQRDQQLLAFFFFFFFSGAAQPAGAGAALAGVYQIGEV